MKKIFGFLLMNVVVILGTMNLVFAGGDVVGKPPNFQVPEPMTLLLLGAGAGAMLGAAGLRRIIKKR